MALLVSPNQIGNREMRIKLRRGDTGVTEQLLDKAQIGSAIEQVRRKTVTQCVRMYAIEIHVLDANAAQLAHAAAGSVEQFQHCALAWLRGARKQPRDFRFAEAARQAARGFGRAYERGGRKANQASNREEAEELAHSYHVAANRIATGAFLPEARNEASQPGMRDAANIIRFQEIEESPN